MAETTALTRRIDLRLESVARRLHALTTLRDESGFDSIALEAEWRDTLDRLDWLHQLAVAGDLTAEQTVLHVRMVGLLARCLRLGTLERLGLQAPRGDLAEWLAQHPEAELADSA